MGNKFLKGCRIATSGNYSDWSPDDVKKWIKANAGVHEPKVSASTTQLVVSKEVWRKQTQIILDAYEINRGSGNIRIVSFDWLDDSFSENTKKRESSYLWEKIDPIKSMQTKKAKQAKKIKERVEQDSADEEDTEFRGARNAPATLAEVLYNATDSFVPDSEKKEIDRSIELGRQAKRDQEAEERAERLREAGLNKAVASWKKGAKKARNELFSENHHVYTDTTNFKYDVLLTKVDTRQNKNERWALTIYESNSEPYTYAINAQFGSTGNQPTNNILAAIGCNFPTAFRAFKNTFKEKTGVEWDQRVDHAIERNKNEKLARGRVVGSDIGTVGGVPVSESFAAAGKNDDDFKAKPFLYHPPAYGSRGLLPSTGKPEGAAHINGNADQAADSERIEARMSGANGSVLGSKQSPMTSPIPAATDQNYANVWNDMHTSADPVSRDKTDQDGVGGNNTFYDGEEMHFDESFFTGPAVGMDNPYLPQTSIDLPDSEEDGAMQWDSHARSTQGIGETQRAEKVQEEWQDFMDRQDTSSTIDEQELEHSSASRKLPEPETEDQDDGGEKWEFIEIEDGFGHS